MSTPQHVPTYTPGQHLVKGIPFKAHKITGFSAETLEHHYEIYYGGAIRRLNEIELEIAANSDGNTRVLREEQLGVETAIILHEIYFDSIGEDGGLDLSNAALERTLSASFGSHREWQAQFSANAISAKTQWMLLAWSERFQRLENICATSIVKIPPGTIPLLVLDMAEHAYSTDFGTNRGAYVDAFMNSVNWKRVAERFQQAMGTANSEEVLINDGQISVGDLKERLDKGEDVVVLDVRHDDDRERYRSRIMETGFRDSFDVSKWAKDLPKDKPVVVYCMYGFWVSMRVSEELREQGIDARSLSGGVLSWSAMGYPSSNNEF